MKKLLERLRILKPKSRWKIDNDNPKYYDGRNPGWGQHISWWQLGKGGKYDITDGGPDNGTYLKVTGHWSRRPRPGDFVVKSFEKGPVLLVFVEVRPCNDPPDMFFGTVGYRKHLSEPFDFEFDYGAGQRFVKWGPEPGSPFCHTKRKLRYPVEDQ